MKLTEGSGPVIAAKNIRIELKAAFPTIKFSVTSKSYSMGNSVNVSWTDGPTTKEVEKITDKYEAGSFDGMTDCYNYDRTPKPHGSAKYVQCFRTYSERLITKAILAITEEYGIKDIPEVEDYQNGRAYGSPMGNVDSNFGRDHWEWQSLITRTASGMAL